MAEIDQSARHLQDWIVERISDLRPLESEEVVVEGNGSAPGFPSTSGEHDDPIEPPVPRRYFHKIRVTLEPTARPLAERLSAHVLEAAREDRTLGQRFEDATIAAAGLGDGRAVVEVRFEATVGFPPTNGVRGQEE